MTLVYLGIAWMAGIVLAAWLTPPPGLLGLAMIIPLVGFLLWREDRRARLLSIYGLALLLGAGRYLLAQPHFDDRALATYNDQGWVTLTGIVAAEPDVRATYTNLRVQAETLVLEDKSQHPVRGLALVRVPCYPEYRYGDRLEVRGLLETPPVFTDFSYKDYLARQGVYSLVRRPQITLLERGRGNPFWATLYAFKRRAQDTITRILPDPQAALLTGILLGVESGIPADLMDAFSSTGTTHIIAISGFNISIIAGLFTALSSRLFGGRRATPFAVGGIMLYTLLVGASAAVVRAAIMGALTMIALHYGRQADALTSLFAAGILMTAINPHALWDVGFQLSFAATAGLILFTAPLERQATRLLTALFHEETAQRLVGMINEALIVTLAAQITTLPIILYSFRQLSLVTLLTNFLILPAQPGVMLWGGMAALTGLVWLPAGQVLAWVAWLFLTYTIRAVELTARLPYAAVSLGQMSSLPVWVYYGLLLGGYVVSRMDSAQRQSLWQRLSHRLSMKALIAGLALAVILIWIAASSLPDGKLHVVFFDVGQGDAIFIQTPQGRQVLIDGGPDPTTLTAALGRRLPFWDRSLDLVILTHPDTDHLTGLIPVLERYHVGRALDPAYPATSETYARWLELIAEKRIPALVARSGLRVELEPGLVCEVLHPTSDPDPEDKANNASAVTRWTWGQVTFLLPGDIEQEVEAALVDSGQPLEATVLKAPHHGSDTSSSAAFLQAVNPQLVVISVGADNRFGHPSPEVLERLAGWTVLRTDERGTIEIVTDGTRLWVRTEH
ncbi:MAG: DNA internalization-related competence protein ComEC/Rec2 [Anaerolineae bacterium]|jgi:competence protein ComEC|nr:DNA internalization-related competence protein ComEC/Rec2 [Anaerolineae bacterium]MDH7473987.1 DNA internalization-related competence protein ComEC/Rec2 [Anaerolineae bacterium]